MTNKMRLLEASMRLWVSCYTGPSSMAAELPDFKHYLKFADNKEEFDLILEFDRENGNFITEEDLKKFKPKW